ncbi:unnamed protein product [Calicophoron daubneyi]|uniref:K Homology domain-containing protein n=1 Tax=Calicophoron daubneyi TaxID=300641 RepID=A0AAV2T7E5_CALDB
MKRDSSEKSGDGPPSKSQRPAVDLTNVVIRFLIPARAAGIMIGKGGENIKKIRSQYNVKLNIPDGRGPERIMTIEGDLDAIGNIMLDVSPKLKDIMNAKLSDPKRIMGHGPRRRRGPNDELEEVEDEDDSMLDYRILVHESQAGSVIGRGGERIKDLRSKYRMRVIKVYQMLAPLSTDRVVQMVAEPDNAINCLKSVVEAVESAPPRGRREDYDAANFSEPDALNYGGWLSREAVQALSQGAGLPPGAGGMPPMGYNMGGPYMGGEMGPIGGMGPIGRGPMGGGGRGPMGSGRGPRSGGMMGGPRPMMGGGPPGPAPVPPPSGPRSGSAQISSGGSGYGSGYGGSNGPSYESQSRSYDNGGMYGGIEQSGSSGMYGQGFGSSSGGMGSSGGGYGSSSGYGSSRAGGGDISNSGLSYPQS